MPGVVVVYSDLTEDPTEGETDFVLPEDDRLCGGIPVVGLCIEGIRGRESAVEDESV